MGGRGAYPKVEKSKLSTPYPKVEKSKAHGVPVGVGCGWGADGVRMGGRDGSMVCFFFDALDR